MPSANLSMQVQAVQGDLILGRKSSQAKHKDQSLLGAHWGLEKPEMWTLHIFLIATWNSFYLLLTKLSSICY